MKWDDFKNLTLSEIFGFLFIIIVMTPIFLVLLSMLV